VTIRPLIVFLLLCSAAASQPLPKLVFVSDTQQPIWIETLRLQEDDNIRASRSIYRSILQESSAVAVVHLGDITSIGMLSSYWGPFDEFQRSLRVPIHPALGNHDYFFFRHAAMEQFRQRFPERTTSWYAFTVQRVGIIILNSNFSRLSDEEQEQQQTWYRAQLIAFDEDTAVAAVIVACHHSPYTNSSIVEPSRGVQNRFVSLFSMYPKSLLFLSGHAHTYEHFRMRDRDFLVIGGGGGLLQPLLPERERHYDDLYDVPGERRFFHYLNCTVSDSSLQLHVMRLRDDHSGAETADSVLLAFPSPAGR
jgi:hypothetical protein